MNLSLIGGIAALIGAVLAVAGLAGIDGLLILGLLLLVAGFATFFYAQAAGRSNETQTGDTE